MKFNKLLFGGLLATGATLVAAQDADAAETYKVESGDTLTKISHKFAGDNSLVEGIAKDNSIKNVDLIYAGETLTINSKNEAATPVQEQVYQTPEVTYTAPVVETPVQEAPAPVVETVEEEVAAPAVQAPAEVVETPAAPVEEKEETPAAPEKETEVVKEETTSEVKEETPVVSEEATTPAVDAPDEPAETPVVEDTPVVEEPVQEEPVQETTTTTTNAAKEWIAQKESSGSYTATNGKYIGRYQLDSSYLNGDYSPENQEKVADQYVTGRYGSWEGAQAFWMANGWY